MTETTPCHNQEGLGSGLERPAIIRHLNHDIIAVQAHMVPCMETSGIIEMHRAALATLEALVITFLFMSLKKMAL